MAEELTIAGASEIEALGINVLRGLSMDGPAAANSGHQGTAMALAPLAHVLWTRVMDYDAADPQWFDRDRFVLSAGHASILQYSMLHLTGHGLTLDDLKDFRQWDSATPGHPEAGHTAGVEVTTGPLGQGFANAVGLAMAEQNLRARFGAEVCDHFTYTVMGDGCLSEGVSHEAASLAGHLGLGKLIAVYDDNHVTIDGVTELALSDDAGVRFRAYGWQVLEVGSVAEDLDALEAAFAEAKSDTERPTVIILRSHIGYPSPSLTDDPHAHGLAFGAEEIAEAKRVMGLPEDQSFFVPDEVLEMYRTAGARGAEARAAWQARLDAAGIDRAAWDASLAGTGLDGWADALPEFEVGGSVATRKASQAAVSALADVVPGLIGGGADLTGNTGTTMPGDDLSAANRGGRQIRFGVREHAMGSILVGMALHGGVVPFGGTFGVFADYMRPPIRLAALSHAKCVFVFTHDSVGVGEDGPTHQPIEQVMSLRVIPGLQVIRPADANESAGAWKLALEHDGPTALFFTRQNVPTLAGASAARVAEGAYAINDVADPAIVLVGTGSEVQHCVAAAEALAVDGVAARVVSMPSWDRFLARSAEEQAAVLPKGVPTVSIEAGVTLGWHRFADVALGIDRFGASAPGGVVMEKLGMTADSVIAAARDLLD